MGTKTKLLALLESGRGRAVSGQKLASGLGVTRAAVWKAVEALRKQGIEIEALPGSGYRLAPGSDLLTEETLRVYLPATASVLRVEREVPSTNTVAKRWAIEGAPHGALVVAQKQTAGKGRLGRTFESPPGGLYMSVVLRPGTAQPQANPALITAAAAVATCRAVQELCAIQLAVKWVNDLYRGGKKCCGILSEAGTGIESGHIDYIVVGIGINYSTPTPSFAPEVRRLATSLYPEGGAPAPRAKLCAAVYGQLMNDFAALHTKEFLPEYRRHSNVLGKMVTVAAPVPYKARAIDIDEEARLVVEDAAGQRHILSSGEISVKL